MQSSLASKIKFIRSDRYADKLRDYKIFANGILRGKISRNSIFAFEVHTAKSFSRVELIGPEASLYRSI